MGRKYRKLSHHEHKMRDIARSTLPSRNGWRHEARSVHRYMNHRERTHLRAVLVKMVKEARGSGCHDECRACTTCGADLTTEEIRRYDRGAVVGTRRRDALGALFQWYENRVSKLDPMDQEGWLRTNLPDTAAGRHAREHLEWEVREAIEKLQKQSEVDEPEVLGGQS